MTGRTSGHLLGGRVRYEQLITGYRTGIEPVLLAASVPAKPGARVIEAGTGAGAGLLCLAARVPDLCGIGIEREPAVAAVARDNLAANACAAGLGIIQCDVSDWTTGERFDHAFANPPWHQAGPASPDRARAEALHAEAGRIGTWVAALTAVLRPRGTLSLILPAAMALDTAGILSGAGYGSVALIPFWPKSGRPARLAIVQGVRGAAGPGRILAGIVLHEADGTFTAAADAVLRQGGALPC